jgi:hypothetical protein
MHRTLPERHPDERLLDAVRHLGDWLATDQPAPARERLALVLDAPVRSALLEELAPLARVAA